MNYQMFLPAIIAFFISVILCPIFIPFLKKLKFGQYIRDEGPKWHEGKSGTPTMGGIVFLVATAITAVFYLKGNTHVAAVLFVTLGFGLIGFLDDYIKVVMKRNLGLKAWQKMLGQLIVTGVFVYYIMNYTDLSTKIIIPFTGGKMWDLGWLFIPFVFFVVLEMG